MAGKGLVSRHGFESINLVVDLGNEDGIVDKFTAGDFPFANLCCVDIDHVRETDLVAHFGSLLVHLLASIEYYQVFLWNDCLNHDMSGFRISQKRCLY